MAGVKARGTSGEPPAFGDSGGSLRSPQPPAATALLTTILNEIARNPNQIVLLLDDYHHISNNAIHESLAFLAQRPAVAPGQAFGLQESMHKTMDVYRTVLQEDSP